MMSDRENVIRHFQDAISASGDGNRWRFVRADIIEDAITLLKEQEPVRCRNCRHYNTECCTDGFGWCEHRDFGTNDEWYCADGEAGTYAAD